MATGKVRIQIDPKFYRPTEVVRHVYGISCTSVSLYKLLNVRTSYWVMHQRQRGFWDGNPKHDLL